MQKRKLGNQGDMVSCIGFGAWPIGGGMGRVEEREAIATVHAAIDLGITLIDTAQAYRESEGFLGRALAGGKREKVFLATKVSFDFSPRGIRAAIEKSLHDLKTDHVDLYQLHSWSDRYPVEESIEELAKLKEEGKIRLIGVSNYSVEQMMRAGKVARIDSSQPRYNMFDREIERDQIAYCRREGIGIFAHSVFAKGLLTGKYSATSVFPADDERRNMPRFQGAELRSYLERAERLSAVARDTGATLVQLAIAWVLRAPEVTCALCGAKSAKQIEEQVKGAELTLNAETLERIEKVLA